MPTWMTSGNTAVITGGASGLGLEAAKRYAAVGMNVVIADRNAEALEAAAAELTKLAGTPDAILTQSCDVSDLAEMETLREAAQSRFGKVHCLMNNAGVIARSGAPWEDLDVLKTTMSINFGGVVNGCHAFIPSMLAHGEPGAVINSGSKQGITRPPGSYVYNLSKASVVAYTEAIAHAFTQVEGCQLKAHLLIPGFVYTPMISAHIPEKPPFAWTAEQTIDFMMDRLEDGHFYILCPDNEATRAVDEKRIQWNTDDILKNRPAMSRWHPDYQDQFAAYMAGE